MEDVSGAAKVRKAREVAVILAETPLSQESLNLVPKPCTSSL